MVQISTNNSNKNISVSTPNNTVSVSMNDSTAKYYSNLAEKSANNAQNSAQSAEVSAEVAKTYSKNLQPDWIESDINSSAYIKNKPNVVYTSGEGISVENNVISNISTSATWGNINGTLSNQTDLQNTISSLCDKNLSNLTDIGKQVISNNACNKDLSNLSEKGNTKLLTKADVDLSNITSAAKVNVVALGMPDYSAGVEVTREVWRTVSKDSFVYGGAVCQAGVVYYLYVKDSQGNDIPSSFTNTSGILTQFQPNGAAGGVCSGVVPNGYSYKFAGGNSQQKAIECPLKGVE